MFHQDFDRDRLCHSDTACRNDLDNSCPDDMLSNLARLSHLLAEVQLLMGGHTLRVTSGYRCAQLNELVGGASESQHCLGLAADFVCPAAGTPRQIASIIASSSCQFDQLILEFDRWVHISACPPDQKPRRQVLTIPDSKTGYLVGIV